MAVTIKKKALTLTSLVKRLFDNDENINKLATALSAAGYTLTTEPSALKLVGDNGVLTETSVKLTGLEAALKGELSYTGKMLLMSNIEEFIKVGYNLIITDKKQAKASAIYDATMKSYWKDGNKISAIKKYRDLTGAGLKEAKDQVEAWIAETDKAANITEDTSSDAVSQTGITIETLLHKAAKAEESFDTIDKSTEGTFTFAAVNDAPVHLKDATQLHQPVHGTNDTSVYHTIAISKDANVAVRIKKDNDVAIRVYPFNGAGRAACAAAGLDSQPQGHWSIHLHPDSTAMVQKTIGSVLFAMGLENAKISGDVKALIGVGK